MKIFLQKTFYTYLMSNVCMLESGFIYDNVDVHTMIPLFAKTVLCASNEQ